MIEGKVNEWGGKWKGGEWKIMEVRKGDVRPIVAKRSGTFLFRI